MDPGTFQSTPFVGPPAGGAESYPQATLSPSSASRGGGGGSAARVPYGGEEGRSGKKARAGDGGGAETTPQVGYRGTLLIRKRDPLEPYRKPMYKVLGGY